MLKKYILALLSCSAIVACTSTKNILTGPTPPEVKKYGNGLYRSFVYTGSSSLRYIVDAHAGICYCTLSDSTFVIPCSSLKNRVEWQNFITWE
jgi:hypothetical protein